MIAGFLLTFDFFGVIIMRYQGYYIDQQANGKWCVVDDRSGIQFVIENQETKQDCIDYIDAFII
jgi:hypothetical protein